MKTTGKYSHKLYRCTRCHYEMTHGTNHWGEIYPSCPCCQWKHPMEMGSIWVCLEPVPEGYTTPAKWKTVKLSDICKTEGLSLSPKDYLLKKEK